MLRKFVYAVIGWLPVGTLACSCAPPSPDEHLSAASLVFRGTVLSIEGSTAQAPLSSSTGSVTRRGRQSGARAKFKVTSPIKGPVLDEVEVKSEAGGCTWWFSVGQDVTVFAWGSRKSGFSTDQCLMRPFTYQGDRGYNKPYVVALDQYRTHRATLASERTKFGPNRRVLRKQAAFFVKYKDLEDADDAFSHLLRLDVRDYQALVGRGNVRYDAERYEEALADYRAAVAVNAASSEARRGRTLSLVKLSRIEELGEYDRDFTGFNSGYSGKWLSFAGANLAGAKFRGAYLNRVDFANADLRGADFSDADLYMCNFSGAKLAGAKFDNSKQSSYTTFQHAGLQNASFKGAYLFHAKLDHAILDKADFSQARIEVTSIENAVVSSANFYGASITLVNLSGARLDAVNFTDARLSQNTLSGACYDRKTTWPKGFDPVAAGAKTCP